MGYELGNILKSSPFVSHVQLSPINTTPVYNNVISMVKTCDIKVSLLSIIIFITSVAAMQDRTTSKM
jgi:hypothetical protein